MKSEVEAQKKRPAILKMLSRPTKPTAAVAVTLDLKKSWIIGAACSRIPMPAVTLTKSMTQSSQNCGVFHASLTATLWLELSAECFVDGTHPLGFQPARGTRFVKTPNIMKMK